VQLIADAENAHLLAAEIFVRGSNANRVMHSCGSGQRRGKREKSDAK
jgi:hypothetical protein